MTSLCKGDLHKQCPKAIRNVIIELAGPPIRCIIWRSLTLSHHESDPQPAQLWRRKRYDVNSCGVCAHEWTQVQHWQSHDLSAKACSICSPGWQPFPSQIKSDARVRLGLACLSFRNAAVWSWTPRRGQTTSAGRAKGRDKKVTEIVERVSWDNFFRFFCCTKKHQTLSWHFLDSFAWPLSTGHFCGALVGLL